MIRLTGMVMLAAGGVLLGYQWSNRLWERANLFDEMARAVELLFCETEARRPLPRSAQELGASQGGRCGCFFRLLNVKLSSLCEQGLSKIWRDCADECFGDLLKPGELNCFNNLGAVLATGEGLSRGFSHCADELRRMGDDAEAVAKRDGRMWTSLGFAAGLTLAIVLI